MKRGEPPKRKTPLPRQSEPIKRTALKRTAVKKKPRVRDTCAQQFMYAVKDRANGMCEIKVAPDCTGRCDEAHHVVTRARGIGWPFLHDASRNGIGVCKCCHAWIHANIEDAERLCLLRRRPSHDRDPGSVFIQIERAVNGR